MQSSYDPGPPGALPGREQYEQWRERLRVSKRAFLNAARQDLGYGEPVATGSLRATHSLQEPG